MARVFVSHASQDHLLAAELHDWLTKQGHNVFLDQDLRDGIVLGEDWEQRLYERLRWADAVLCLITASYCESAWCTAEVGIARFEGCRLLPLQAQPGQVHPLLMPSRHQYTDWVGDPERARHALGEALRRMGPTGGWDWPGGLSPFPGLRRFDTEYQRVFFGRTKEVAALAAQLRSPANVANRGILLVVGPSGCGKSSLVCAGLLPLMATEPAFHTLAPMVPGMDPIGTLARELARGSKDVGLDWTFGFTRDRLSHDDGLAFLSNELLVASDKQHLLVTIDQFDHMLTLAPASARAEFVDLLRPALADSVDLVGTLRAEFLGILLGSRELADLPTRTFALRPLSRDALASVIDGPARLADISVAPELISQCVGETESGDALPLLAFVLEQLARDLGPGGQLSAARYEELGGVKGALIGQADAALAEAVAVNNRTPDEVIAGLLRLVSIDENARPVRWLVDRDELPAPILAELEAFINRRLLTTDAEGGSVVVGVTHEAFLTAWPPLAAAINADAAALRARRAVELAAVEWDAAGRQASQLWERNQLAAAVGATAARMKVVRSNQGQAANQRQAQSPSTGRPRLRRELVTEKVALTSRGREFLYRSIRRDRSRRWRATTVLVVLLVLAVAAAVVAAVQQDRAQAQKLVAQQQLRIATARQLITEANTSLDDDPIEALQLDIAAVGIQNDPETRGSLANSLISTPYAGVLSAHKDLIGVLAFNPAGSLLVTGSDDDTLRVWKFSPGRLPEPIGDPLQVAADVNAVAFAHDGRILAAALADGTVRLFSIDDSGHAAQIGSALKVHSAGVRGVAIGGDGVMLTAGEDGLLRVWDIRQPMKPAALGPPLQSEQHSLRSLALSPNGEFAVTGGTDSTFRSWKIDRDHSAPLSAPVKPHKAGFVRALAFSSDGKRLASASDDQTTLIWNVEDPRQLVAIGPPLTGHQDEVTSVAFHPKNRNQVVTASDDQTARVWNLAQPAHPVQLRPTLTGARDELYSVAYTPDGSMVLAGARDGKLIFWNPQGVLPAPVGRPLVGHDEGVDPVVFSPTGAFLASASEDGWVKLWSSTDGRVISSLRHEDEVASAAFDPDMPDLLVTASGEEVHFWNVKDPAHPQSRETTLEGHKEVVVALAFCPGRQLLASGDEAGELRLWDLTNIAHPVPIGSPLEGNPEAVDSIACSADGLLAVAGTGMVKILSLHKAQTPVEQDALITGSNQAVNSVAFSPNGKTLVAGGDDGNVTVWDVTGTNLTALGPPLRAHGDPVTSVTFSQSDPTLIATSSDDQTAQMWAMDNRQEPLRLGPPLAGHESAVNSVAIGPKEELATGTDDGTVRLWTVFGLDRMRNDPVGYACTRTGTGLSPDEWRSQVPGLPYQETCRR